MESWRPSTLSWSFSRKTHFDSCRRHYYYHRFWGQDAKLRWRMFEMRHITTLTMLRGQVVHAVIADALNSARAGKPLEHDDIRRSVTDVIRRRYLESYHRLWHIDNRPQGRKVSEITNLLEHYYDFPNTKERARQARDVAVASVENLLGSDFWAGIAASDPETWRAIEEEDFPSFDLDGIRIYARIDFACSGDAPMIVDWKTGAANGQDRSQLALYSLYAQSKWGWDPTQTRLAAVYLQPELRVDLFTPTQDELDAVEELVKASFNEMVELDPAFGPADVEDFPMNGDTSDCKWCRFQGICARAGV